MGLSPSYLFWWQLMWGVTTDVGVSVCGRSGLWPFRFVAFLVCGRSGLWPFRFVDKTKFAWISSLPMGLSPSYLFWWQLMWGVTTDVGVSVCGRSGLWPFRFVAFLVCGRSGLWPFRFVAVSVCGRFGLWPFRFVAVSVCGRFGCGRFGLWPLWPVILCKA